MPDLAHAASLVFLLLACAVVVLMIKRRTLLTQQMQTAIVAAFWGLALCSRYVLIVDHFLEGLVATSTAMIFMLSAYQNLAFDRKKSL